ncbi:acyltransferase [Neobacillus mesonae]|nr:acyltransferase [Neobacillus mesonae]
MPKKPKITAIETLRGLAFLAVVLQHSIAHYAYVDEVTYQDSIWMSVILMLSKFAVPVFIFITGMVLFYNYEERLDSKKFLKRRWIDIFLPYLIWSLIYIWKAKGLSGFMPAELVDVLLKLLTGKSSYHLWYIIMIMQFYLLFPLIRRLVIFVNKRVARHSLLLLIIAGVIYIFLMTQIGEIGMWAAEHNIPILTPLFTIYADRNAIYFFFYFLLGAAAGLYTDGWQNFLKRSRYVVLTLFIFGCAEYVFLLCRSFITSEGLEINFNRVSLLKPDMALFLIVSVLMIYQFALWLDKGKTAAALAWVGTFSYGAYLMHALMLKASYWFDAVFFASWSVTVRMFMSFLIASALSLILTRIISSFRAGKWIAGTSMYKSIK